MEKGLFGVWGGGGGGCTRPGVCSRGFVFFFGLSGIGQARF